MNHTESNKLISELESLGYRIWDEGTVIGKRGKPIATKIGTNGYKRLNITIQGKTTSYSIHRLVALKYIPNPENKREVNHINGIKTDNRAENLEWVTRSENMLHGFKNGLIPPPWEGKSGISHHKSKQVLQKDKTNTVLAVYGSAREAARKTGICYGTISNVLIGRGKTAGGFKWEYK